MSREIKFRAWDKDSKIMFYMHPTERNTDYNMFQMSVMEDGSISWNLGSGDHNSIYHGTDEDEGILMQYTGLKDKNGVEIYERDIVRRIGSNYDNIGVVNYDDYNVSFRIQCKYLNYYIRNFCEYEVIGNIYENPELLGDTQ